MHKNPESSNPESSKVGVTVLRRNEKKWEEESVRKYISILLNLFGDIWSTVQICCHWKIRAV